MNLFSDLKGRRVVVTGGSRGIGLATAKAYLAQGSHVAIVAHEAPEGFDAELAELRAGGAVVAFVKADLTDSTGGKAAIDEAAAAIGGIDVLINNVGGLGGRRALGEIDDPFYDLVMDLNVRSVVMTTQAALPYLKASAEASGQTSSVVLVGSFAAYMGGGPGAGVYAGAKAFVQTIAKNWVTFNTKDGIRFNVVSPGTFDTAFHADKNEATRAKISEGIPLGRFGKPEEIAPTFLFLGSHACSGYITGQIINVNGGQWMP